MVTLPVYTEGTQTVSTGDNMFRPTQASTALGQGVEQLGQGISKIGLYGLQVQKQRAEVQANLTVSAADIDYKQQLEEERFRRLQNIDQKGDANGFGGSGFAAGMKDYADALATTVSKKYGIGTEDGFSSPQKAAVRFQGAAAAVLNQSQADEYKMFNQFKVKVANAETQNSVAVVGQNPALFNQEMARLDKLSDGWGFMPEAKTAFMREARTHLETTAIANKASQDPTGYLNSMAGALTVGPKPDAPANLKPDIGAARAHGIDPRIQLGVKFLESGVDGKDVGQPMDKNGKPMSSAIGPYQLTNSSGTTLTLEQRKDPVFAANEWARMGQRDKAVIEGMGMQATPGIQYMFHNLGGFAAPKALRADPNERVGDFLNRIYGDSRLPATGERWADIVARNNPSMYKPDWTVGQMLTNYERQMQRVMVEADKQLASPGDDTAIASVRSNLTRWAGMDIQNAEPKDLVDLTKKVEAQVRQNATLQNKIDLGNAFNRGDLVADPQDKSHKEAVNEVAKMNGLAQGITDASPDAYVSLRANVSKSSIVPDVVAHQLNDMVVDSKLAQHPGRTQAVMFLRDLQANNPVAYQHMSLSKDARDRIGTVSALLDEGGFGSDVTAATQRADVINSPEYKKNEKLLAEGMRSEKESLKMGDMPTTGAFWSMNWKPEGALGQDIHHDPAVQLAFARFKSEYEFLRTTRMLPPNDAKREAASSVDKSFGLTYQNEVSSMFKPDPGAHMWMPFNGETGPSGLNPLNHLPSVQRPNVMFLPPEKLFNTVDGSHDWIGAQAREKIGAMFNPRVSGTADRPSYVETNNGHYDTERSLWSDEPSFNPHSQSARYVEYALLSDGETAKAYDGNRTASYRIQYRDPINGKVVMVPGRFTPDYARAQHDAAWAAWDKNNRVRQQQNAPTASDLLGQYGAVN